MAALLLVLGGVPQTPDPSAPVVTEFRVFDGRSEVTASMRLRLWRSGRRDAEPLVPDEPVVALPPAIYDVEVRHVDPGGVVTVKRSERLAIVHYPDEGGRHLQVINLQSGFGALQLRASRGELDANGIALFREGSHTVPVVPPVAVADYILFVVPAGRYDVRIQHRTADSPPDVHWLLGVEVPAEATRLKLVDGSG